MSTISGNSKQLKVIDPNGNVWLMTLVDAEARQAIDEAKDLQFDESFFTSEESNNEVYIGLNGVPVGVDTNTPLDIVQDSQEGIVFGSKAPFSTAIAPEYDSTSPYSKDQRVTNLGKYWKANQDIDTAEEWTPAHWDEIDVDSQLGSSSSAMVDLGIKTELDLISGVNLPISVGNSVTQIVLVTVNALTVISNPGVPNFALEIDNTGNSKNVIVSVLKNDGETVMRNSIAAGTIVPAGKYYQVTAVGNCWTMAEFLDNGGEGSGSGSGSFV